MDYIIREMRSEEYCLLSDFLYEAIYIPDGIEPPPKSVIDCPELQEYIIEFGNRKHDKALVAEIQGNIVGAIWVRIMNDYGHIDNDTPSLAMSVCPQYRGLGIGTSLLKQLLQVERLAGYSKISLSVQKSNYAVKMYEKVGFTVVDGNSEEYIKHFDIPILGICLGHQLIAKAYGGQIDTSNTESYAKVEINIVNDENLFSGLAPKMEVWSSHKDEVKSIPDDFEILANSNLCDVESFKHTEKDVYGIQFHPEVHHTPKGSTIFENFYEICKKRCNND